MEDFDLASMLIGAAIAVIPQLMGMLREYVKKTPTKVDDQILEAIAGALQKKE